MNIIQGDLKMQNVTINGVEYAPVAARPTGTRAVVVVDRGWIFAGDVTRENGRIRLSKAVHVFSWESIGFAKMVETEKADLRPIADIDMPEGAEIFCVPVHDGWGKMTLHNPFEQSSRLSSPWPTATATAGV